MIAIIDYDAGNMKSVENTEKMSIFLNGNARDMVQGVTTCRVNRAFTCRVNRAFTCRVNRAFTHQVNRASTQRDHGVLMPWDHRIAEKHLQISCGNGVKDIGFCYFIRFSWTSVNVKMTWKQWILLRIDDMSITATAVFWWAGQPWWWWDRVWLSARHWCVYCQCSTLVERQWNLHWHWGHWSNEAGGETMLAAQQEGRRKAGKRQRHKGWPWPGGWPRGW